MLTGCRTFLIVQPSIAVAIEFGKQRSRSTWAAWTAWTAKTWTAKTWTAKTWTAKTWTAKTWTAKTWTAKTWTAKTWTAESWATWRRRLSLWSRAGRPAARSSRELRPQFIFGQLAIAISVQAGQRLDCVGQFFGADLPITVRIESLHQRIGRKTTEPTRSATKPTRSATKPTRTGTTGAPAESTGATGWLCEQQWQQKGYSAQEHGGKR
jgi:hypothetical protein